MGLTYDRDRDIGLKTQEQARRLKRVGADTADLRVKDDGRDKQHTDDLLAFLCRLLRMRIDEAEQVVGRVECADHAVVPYTHRHGRHEERDRLQQGDDAAYRIDRKHVTGRRHYYSNI